MSTSAYMPVCACVLIHRVKGVVMKGVTLTHTVSYYLGEIGL